MGVIILLTMIISFPILYYYWNYTIEKRIYTIETMKNISENIKIFHISDLHGNKKFYKKLTQMVYEEKPDVVVITGDLVDDKSGEYGINFIKSISLIPIYYVTGNHELRLEENKFNQFIRDLENLGVKILDNIETDEFKKGIRFIGVSDLALKENNIPNYARKLNDKEFNVLLMHQPEAIRYLRSYNTDIIFAGHAHGGQWRIPYFNQGIFAPDQGVFPPYTSGMYEKYNTKMFVSRGVGSLTWIPRIFNRPHVIVVNIKKIK